MTEPRSSHDWQAPRCLHGHILLGCPDDGCADQNDYIRRHLTEPLAWWHQQQQDEARRIVRQELGLEP